MTVHVWSLDGWTGYEGDEWVDGDVVWHIERSTGWHTSAAPRLAGAPRSRGHGWHDGISYRDARRVALYGWLFARNAAALEDAMESFAAICADGEDLQQVQVVTGSRTRTAMVRLADEPLVQPTGRWNAAVTLPLLAPDPRKYGAPSAALSTGLPTAGTGLAYPLAYPLDYGALGATGQVTLVNPGTAPAPIDFRVTGELPSGFEISAAETGQRLVYVERVPTGQTLHGHTGRGTLRAEGTSERRGNLTVADWMLVPARGQLTLQFTSLGGAFDAAAGLTVPEPRAAFW